MTSFSVSYGVGLTFSFILDILSLMWMDLEGHNINNFGIQQLTNYYGHLDTASEGSSDTGTYLLPNMIPDAEQFLWGCEKRREFRVTTKNCFVAFRNCFTQSDLQETLDEFKVDACTVVEARIFELIILTRASCILGQADEYEEVAEFLWKVQELATALELRNNYIQQTNEIKRRWWLYRSHQDGEAIFQCEFASLEWHCTGN